MDRQEGALSKSGQAGAGPGQIVPGGVGALESQEELALLHGIEPDAEVSQSAAKQISNTNVLDQAHRNAVNALRPQTGVHGVASSSPGNLGAGTQQSQFTEMARDAVIPERSKSAFRPGPNAKASAAHQQSNFPPRVFSGIPSTSAAANLSQGHVDDYAELNK